MTPKARLIILLCASCVACAPLEPPTVRLGPDGQPLPKVYAVSEVDPAVIQFRMLDSVNALRQATGAAALILNAELNAAAATHARDMSVQNRPWHFGSDGSSPIDRVARVGYNGSLLGENISETYETELDTLAAWMGEQSPREILLDPRAKDMGFAWFQDSSGKIWWTLLTGTGPQLTDSFSPIEIDLVSLESQG